MHHDGALQCAQCIQFGAYAASFKALIIWFNHRGTTEGDVKGENHKIKLNSIRRSAFSMKHPLPISPNHSHSNSPTHLTGVGVCMERATGFFLALW
jgi:hypothetical protein